MEEKQEKEEVGECGGEKREGDEDIFGKGGWIFGEDCRRWEDAKRRRRDGTNAEDLRTMPSEGQT